jgi:hypothetical protein
LNLALFDVDTLAQAVMRAVRYATVTSRRWKALDTVLPTCGVVGT